jgi:hypothetical protein
MSDTVINILAYGGFITVGLIVRWVWWRFEDRGIE